MISQSVSIVAPMMRPSDPPKSHSSDWIVYAAFVSMNLYFISEKNICITQALMCTSKPSVQL